MNTKKIAYLLAFVLLFGVAFSVKAADNNRYLVKTTAGVWKRYFGVRHTFDDGFTTDLSDFQIRFTKIFGIEIEPVKKLYVLPAQATDLAVDSQKDYKVLKTSAKNPRLLPVDQVPWGIKMIYNNLSLVSTYGGLGINVAILDTGILKTHPDLKNRVKDCKDFSNPKASLVDGKCDDRNGHGTHVAGIIVADGGSDGLGIFGVAPAASLFVYQVCSANGSCWADDVAAAVKMAADNGANILNLSLGSDAPSSLVSDAVSYAYEKNVLVVGSAGNDGPYIGSIDYPAADSRVIGVGALDVNKIVPDWSSRGTNSQTKAYVVENGDIEFAAPGVSVESTWKDGGYAILSGTSMAAPHISGLAAKLWQKDALNPADATRDILHKLSSDLLPLGDDDDSGWGIPTL
ncbi:MAG: S8 family peptidase [Patescibacteria group bacterium]